MSEIESRLKTEIQNNSADSFLVIVPNVPSRQNRERKLIGYHPESAITNLQVQEIVGFINRLYSQIRPPRRHISSGIQRLWLNEITGSDKESLNNIDTFRPIQIGSVPDSTLSLIVDTINNLKGRIETQLEFVEESQTRTELDTIYRSYENKLGSQWIDEQGKHLFLAENFDEKFFKSAFPRVNLVVVEGFTVLSKANIELLKQIANIESIEMWFRTDCYFKNKDLYWNVVNLVKEFEDSGVKIDANFERESELHHYFAENLFNSNNKGVKGKDLSEKIKLLKSSDRSEEVETIAHTIKTLVEKENCNLKDICVTYYNISKYQQRITEVFSDYDIPYTLSEKVSLAKSTLVKEIFSLFTSNRDLHPNVYFTDNQNILEKKSYSPQEFLDCISNILNESKTLRFILTQLWQEKSDIVEAELNSLQSFREILQEFCSVLKSEGQDNYPTHELVRKLHYIAKHTFYQKRASRTVETVKIIPLGEIRTSEFDYVFLGDFVDGGFPVQYRTDPLLPENPYRTEDEHLYDSRFLFYRVLKAFKKKLYLLSPSRDRDTELIPSIFMTQLEEICQTGSEEIIDIGQHSMTGFLSVYGDYVWRADEPVDESFPPKLEELRPIINHVVQVEKNREDTKQNTIYEGRLCTDELSLDSQRKLKALRDRVYSVSDLEIYANCPFQFFMSKILKTKIEEEDKEDEISKQDKGTLAHKVLFKFFKDRRDDRSPGLSPYSQENSDEAKKQLKSILDKMSDEKRIDRGTSEQNLIWSISINKLRAALFRWIEAEQRYPLSVLPRFFEVSFGGFTEDSDPELSSSEPIKVNDVKMRGKIDRIDIGENYFNVVDYKTGGSTIGIQDIREGRSLQLSVYLKVAESLFAQYGNMRGLSPAAGLYQKIRLREFRQELGIGKEQLNGNAYQGYKGSSWYNFGSTNRQCLEDDDFNSFLDRICGYVELYIERITEGFFPLITRAETDVDLEIPDHAPDTPRDPTKPCNYCNYKRQCRVRAFEEEYQVE